MKQQFIELTKGNGDKYFIDLCEISHIVEHRAAITIYFKNGCKEDFANASYSSIKELLLAIHI